jgi:YD repeat-containing protein
MRFLCLIIFCISLPAHSKVYRYAYFAEFPFWESPIQPYKFAKPLTQTDAVKRIHIQVAYDEQNRIIDIQTRQGDQFKALGNYFDAMYVHAVHTKISYQDEREIHEFYNQLGNQVTGWGDVWQKIYHKDERGRYTKMDFLDRAGLPIENSWGIAYYSWQHNLDASVIEQRFSQTGELITHRRGFEFKRIRLVYDSSGHLRLMQNIDPNHALLASKSGASQYAYYYDSQGLFSRWEIYDDKGQPAIGPSNTAGEIQENLPGGSKNILFFNQTGGPAIHWSGSVYSQIRNDTYGNIMTLALYNAEKQPVNGNYKYAKIVYEWDNKGMHLSSKTYQDTSGNPTLHLDGYNKVTYSYNSVGLLTEQHFLDLDGKPVMSDYDKAAVIKFDYDKHGQRVGSRKLDLDGKNLVSNEES